MRISDWSSDVCSSDLQPLGRQLVIIGGEFLAPHLRQETVAQDDEGPALHARGARNILRPRLPRLHHRFLHQIVGQVGVAAQAVPKRAQLRSAEHTSELQSLMRISYAVFFLKKK